MKNEIGVIGLGTMGKSLALNLSSNGFKVAGYNRSFETTKKIIDQNVENFSGYEHLNEFIDSLEKPRKVILMVKAGSVVDTFNETLLNVLEENDIIMDCGNSYYKDTIRRTNELAKNKIHFFGVGVSGGEKGALLGPSIMPGGDKHSYKHIEKYLNTISAKKNGEACCTYIGPDGAGHYVKMVHNGIEYADMQLIAEVYLFLRNALKLSNVEISSVFSQWNETDVKSYLIDITSKILLVKDVKTGKDLVDLIVDEASQKGTGKWTTLEAIDQDQNISLIQSAVQARIISNMKKERITFNKGSFDALRTNIKDSIKITIEEVRIAYSLGKRVAYAQGFSQMSNASTLFGWNLNLKEIASIFRAGCIIQAELLEVLMKVYEKNSSLVNFLLDDSIFTDLMTSTVSLRKLCMLSLYDEIPIPVLNSAITYIDQLKSKTLGANVIQAQRDFFGAHTFERIDTEGTFHYEWEE